MLAQLKYALLDISEHILRYIANFIQILVCFLLIAASINTFSELNSFSESIKKLRNLENIYIMNDVTDYEHYDELICNPEYAPVIHEFFDYLTSSEQFDSYVAYKYYLYIDGEGKEVYFCDNNFGNIYGLTLEDGTALSTVFSSNYGEYTPVVMGRGYKNRYSVGDIIETDRGAIIVAGFFRANTYCFNLSASKEPVYLDSEIVCPLMMEQSSDIVDYLGAIEHTHIISDDPQTQTAIADESDRLGLFKFHFKSLQTQVDNIAREEQEKIQSMMLIVILILSLCVCCMTSFFLTFIEDHLREFAIHLLSGATLSSIVLRVVIQIGIPVLLANIAASMQYKSSYIMLTMFAISAIVFIFITIAPITKIYRLGINGILKRFE